MGEGRIGVIGGSGLYGMEGLDNIREVAVDTPFGAPSDAYVIGTLADRELVFLPRHGRGHRISPSTLNSRANIHGFKQLGVEAILSVSAVGSMREDIHPGDLVLPDQFVDRTRGRVSSFFDQDVVAHVTFADPTCAHLGQVVYEAASKTGATVHAGGTYICIEGPQFSTRAESRIYRQWGVDVIGMTNLPEARLAREAELCYVTIAMVTDYDCWHDSAADVDVEAILTLLHRNAELAQDVIRHAAPNAPRERACPCRQALQYAMITAPEAIPAAARERYQLLIGSYLT